MYFVKISIHALREESDSSRLIPGRRIRIFQSTLSVRRATRSLVDLAFHLKFQSTLSVRRATLAGYAHGGREGISIHALREESDHAGRRASVSPAISIHALREESDSRRSRPCPWCYISIHALREESDK